MRRAPRNDAVAAIDSALNKLLIAPADLKALAEQAPKDRARNNALAADGYRWHRFGYADIVHSLNASIRLLRTLLQQGDPRVAF